VCFSVASHVGISASATRTLNSGTSSGCTMWVSDRTNAAERVSVRDGLG
jgi:hypothetical protein